MLAIVGAMDEEIRYLISKVKILSKEVEGQTEVWRAEGPRGPFLIAKSGIGKVAAAASTQILITKYGADRILFSGVAGGLKDGIRRGDIVMATDLVQHDFHLEAFGRKPGEIPGVGESVVCDGELARQFRKAYAEAAAENPGFPKLHEGRIATGDCIVADSRLKKSIAGTFGAVAAEMEGAALGQVCKMNRVPFLVVRTVSDNADESAIEDYGAFVRSAGENDYQILKKFF